MAEKMEVTPLTLTEDGLRLQAKVQTGLTKLNLVKVIIGYGFLDETESPLRITDVKNEIPSRQTGDSGSAPTVDLTRKFQDDEEAMSLITVTVQNGDNDFTYCREFLFLALDSTTDEIIKYAYANLGENGLPLPKYNGKSHVAYNIDFPTAITNADDVEIHTTLVSGTPWDEFMNHVNNTDNPHTIEFTEAETLLNITSGERLSLIFGKVKKAIASLISHLEDASNPHNVTVEQIGAIPISAKGSAGGVAELDESGTVPSSQLPSYVDDVIECNGISAFPTTGESGKIYVDILTNRSYRWSGSQYTEISKSLAIGTTSSTAFAGDKGQTAYEHSQQPHAPSNANYYVHPSSHSADMITETTSRRFVSDNEKSTWNGKANASHTHSISSVSGLQNELKSLNDKIEALASVSTNATYMKHLLNRDNYSECSNIGDWNVTYSQYQSGSAYSDSGVLILTDANNVPEQSKTPIFFRAYSNNNDDQVEYIQELLYLDGTRYYRTKLLWWYQGGEQSNPQWSNWIDGFYREDTF